MTTARVITAGALIVAITAAGLAARQSPPVFTSKIVVVRIDALVTDHGKPVPGLQPADFEVRDNGVPQQVTAVGGDEVPINVILALDLSGSVEGDRLDHLRVAGRTLLDAMRADDQAALVGFSHVVMLGSALTKRKADVLSALAQAESGGETSLVDATYAGLMLGESDNGRALLLAFSDGVDTDSWLTPDRVVDIGRRSETVVYGVAVKTAAAPEFLRDLSTATGGALFEIASTKDLGAEFLRILDEFRHRYQLSYVPHGVAATGAHRIEVRIKGRDVKVRTKPGYLAGDK